MNSVNETQTEQSPAVESAVQEAPAEEAPKPGQEPQDSLDVEEPAGTDDAV